MKPLEWYDRQIDQCIADQSDESLPAGERLGACRGECDWRVAREMAIEEKEQMQEADLGA